MGFGFGFGGSGSEVRVRVRVRVRATSKVGLRNEGYLPCASVVFGSFEGGEEAEEGPGETRVSIVPKDTNCAHHDTEEGEAEGDILWLGLGLGG